MGVLSVLRYRNAVCRVPRNPIREGPGKPRRERIISLRMKHPIQGVIFLRENTFDFITFEEVVFEQVYRAVPVHLHECDRIVDLGANIGLASLYLAAFYSSCKIVAVEPQTENYRLLTKNLAQLIKSERCLPLQAAVWSADKSLVIEEPGVPGRYNAFTVREAAPCANSRPSIEGSTIQRIMEQSGFHEADLVKVDIEGAEIELFKGDLGWLNRVGAIAIEFHGTSRTISNFDNIMRQYGFAIQAEGGHTVLAVRGRKTNSSSK